MGIGMSEGLIAYKVVDWFALKDAHQEECRSGTGYDE
jgi:hypothetical protein